MSGKRKGIPGNSTAVGSSPKVTAIAAPVAAPVAANAVPAPNEPHNMGQPADKTLLFVSDLEGCVPTNSKGVIQSRQLCDPAFFKAIRPTGISNRHI